MVTVNSHEFIVATGLCECDHIPSWVRDHVHNCGVCGGSSASPDFADKAWSNSVTTYLGSLGTFVGRSHDIARVIEWCDEFSGRGLPDSEDAWFGVRNTLSRAVRRLPHAQ